MSALAPQVHLMVAARLGPDAWDAGTVDDVTQNALLAVADGLSTLRRRTVAGLRAFTSTIVARRVADLVRQRRCEHAHGRRAVSLDSTVGDVSGAGPLWQFLSLSGTSPRTAAERAEQIAGILSELRQLKPEHRQVITYAFFDQLATGEIARRMNLSRAAASMLLIRAVNALRRRVAQRERGRPSRA